ncbi:hypothetical protein DCAR_0207311 [Daucus carota subsp. sativus]|uniref:Rab-GAP TBC domain-containing protein n=1 Tax=Daucus carota subsp. sativus TaxID=79200 RepID=A0AAF1AME3_DAUCS|nr:PREDICTED: ecotropic viral integration site 5 protein homolog isoform X1 [Daucus carota subsp. sativus]WOG88078.1 hypothetical protein DCAR_0207311 [Daucus carota subsp. sativus]
MKAKVVVLNPPLNTFEHKRDAYGFAIRPQHLQRYREYAKIYKEEEEERSDRWSDFLDRQAESAELAMNELSTLEIDAPLAADATEEVADDSLKKHDLDDTKHDLNERGPHSDSINEDVLGEEEVPLPKQKQIHRILTWSQIRPSLSAIEDMMSGRVKKRTYTESASEKPLSTTEETKPPKGGSEDDSEEEFYDVERSDSPQDIQLNDSVSAPAIGDTADIAPTESSFPWKEELECLVQGGVPMALRGELWQAFVGVRTRRVEKYYQDLLALDNGSGDITEHPSSELDTSGIGPATEEPIDVPAKWKGQIEKDLPRTFPGHPALDEDGRNSLRRLLTAYARHNPSVGYCQAMNFFAGLLLLLMPEENAFWALMGILDDYFEGYYSEEMIESQVDQLVFEELVRERFPKLVNHLDYLGVQVAWVTGPWFLSIFMNMLPWESVLRVWDVLLFEGNRVMLFRTALALMELYGPALVTTKDAGDAITLLQSLAGSTFDSSQLVLTACMGYPNVNESRLEALRNKHRPSVLAAIQERSSGLRSLTDSQSLASKLYIFKHDAVSLISGTKKTDAADERTDGDINHTSSSLSNSDDLSSNVSGVTELDSVPDIQEQVVWLKAELCKLLEDKRSAILRAEELETALMEMVKQDNRRELSAKVEQLERDVAELQQALSDKQEQESVMLQVLMRVEQEQRLTEDARRFAEQDAEAQRYAAQVLQEKLEATTASLAEMEKRVVMAESMLEATLQYQSGQNKAQPSPRSVQDSSAVRSSQEALQEFPTRKISLLSRPFNLGWREKNKEKPANVEESAEDKSANDKENPSSQQLDTNGHQMEEIELKT